MYWNFGYNPAQDTITRGLYIVEIDTAVTAARVLTGAIYRAARAVDQRETARLRERTIRALSKPGAALATVSSGLDNRIWVSLPYTEDARENRQNAAQTVVAALRTAGLRLSSSLESQSTNLGGRTEQLARGETLYVTSDAPALAPRAASRTAP
jgi:hypothetical protein